jgi:hypothetical protein
MELLQDAVVTLFALGAVVMLVRRFVSFAKPGSAETACASCPSSAARPRKAPPDRQPAAPAEPRTHPVTFVRPGAH